ncbi:MAG: phasin family protein [Proteobacteria bacterium]|nr:phasin family protein [Pseudomonadota bacterium]
MADEALNPAEKAYAAAAEQVKAPAAAPAKAEPAKIEAKVAEVKAAPKAAKPAKAPKAKTVAAKAKVAKPAKTVAKAKVAKPAAKRAAPKAAKTIKTAPLSAFAKLKETAMTKTTDFTSTFQSAIAEAQDKAKAAFDKSTAAFGDYNEFTKGNAEALVEAGKILATGLKGMGEALLADSKGAYETLVADVKSLTAVKSPADFYKLQGELVKKHFDQAVAYGSKQSEAVLKLATDAVTPVSNRVNVAIEKFKAAA